MTSDDSTTASRHTLIAKHRARGRNQRTLRPFLRQRDPDVTRTVVTNNGSAGSGCHGMATANRNPPRTTTPRILRGSARNLLASEQISGDNCVFKVDPPHSVLCQTGETAGRILDVSDGKVTFQYKDRKDNNETKTVTLEANEFIRRFLLHVLPHGFQRVRHYGLFANRSKKHNLARCRELLNVPALPQPATESTRERMLRLTGIDIALCPHCKKGTLHFIREIPSFPDFITPISPFTTEVYDTS